MATFPEHKQAQWNEGIVTDAYNYLGAHQKGDKIQFRVWAPHAEQVHVVGDFNNWEWYTDALQRVGNHGFWETELAKAKPEQLYKFAITHNNNTILKADPFAFFGQHDSYHSSIIHGLPSLQWGDDDWMNERANRQQRNKPMSIYEVHLGSWRHKPNGQPLTYQQLAEQLIPYVNEMGFTHIELMPIMEHPFSPSWGYQVTGFFAPTSRYGRPEEFMAFIDACHQNDIGVLLDWVPGHFPRDEHGLYFFDGTPLFEHADHRRREHADWGTHNFDYEKTGVRNFLLSNALFWCREYHIDGFRVDAVASMLYLDYSREGGDWLPNQYGGNENMAAIRFLQDFNRMLGEEFPGVITVAEESTAWPGVTTYVEHVGLDFDYKWNMGWMNDTLNYFSTWPDDRHHKTDKITFPRTFAFSERFILPLSHDEVVHLKKSLWSKMPGSDEQKFLQLRLLYLYMFAFPGKNLLFMGSELAEIDEWSEKKSLNWELLDNPQHKKLQQFLQKLLKFYRSEPALYATDDIESGFEWVDLTRSGDGVFSFRRLNTEHQDGFIFILNFSFHEVRDYINDALWGQTYRVVMDSRINKKPNREVTDSVNLMPFQGIILKNKS